MLNRIAAVAALSLIAVGSVHAASQEEWGNPSPRDVMAQSASATTRVAAPAPLVQAERPDYLKAPAGQLSRADVQADTQRWNAAGLRQFGSGEGGALYYGNVRQGLNSYNSQI